MELFREPAAGGFTRFDGTVQFCSRVNALIHPDAVVLEFGAGVVTRSTTAASLQWPFDRSGGFPLEALTH